MRDKVLELLHKVLENSSTKNMFHNTPFGTNGSPIRVVPYQTRFNIDGASDEVTMELLSYTLHFKEGDPEIKVYTNVNYTIKEEPYKSYFFGLKQYMTKVYHYTTETIVSFGEFSFPLTPTEERDLIEATKQSYAINLVMIDETYNEKLLKAVHKQLGYYGGAREN